MGGSGRVGLEGVVELDAMHPRRQPEGELALVPEIGPAQPDAELGPGVPFQPQVGPGSQPDALQALYIGTPPAVVPAHPGPDPHLTGEGGSVVQAPDDVPVEHLSGAGELHRQRP